MKNGETGYLVPEKDEEKLVEAIIDVVKNREKAKNMALKGQKLCRRLYSHEIMGEKIKELYLENLQTDRLS